MSREYIEESAVHAVWFERALGATSQGPVRSLSGNWMLF